MRSGGTAIQTEGQRVPLSALATKRAGQSAGARWSRPPCVHPGTVLGNVLAQVVRYSYTS